MSNLSQAECSAGISRQALETIKRKNGDAPHDAHNVRNVEPAPYISDFRETSVIDTPMRKLSVLEKRDGQIIVRDVEFCGTKADVTHLHLEREQAHTLAHILERLDIQPKNADERDGAGQESKAPLSGEPSGRSHRDGLSAAPSPVASSKPDRKWRA